MALAEPGITLGREYLTFTEYQSFLVKGSCVLFLRPFLPLDNRLFLEPVRYAAYFGAYKFLS